MILLVVLIIVLIVTSYNRTSYHQITGKSFFQVMRDKGSEGEYQIYKSLSFLEKEGAKFLFNAYLPMDNGETTECDVILIAPKGIIVFESKNYSGWIFGNEKQKMWTQTLPQGAGKPASKEKFFNPIMQNKLHIDYLAKATNGMYPIYSIVVFSKRCELKKLTVYNNNIQVIKQNELLTSVKNIFNYTSPCISQSEVERLYNSLLPYTQVSDEIKQQHIQNINSHH